MNAKKNGHGKTVTAARVREIKALCDKASYIEQDDKGATAYFTFEGKELAVVAVWLRKQFKEQEREQREFNKRHKFLLRTNPKYRTLWEKLIPTA